MNNYQLNVEDPRQLGLLALVNQRWQSSSDWCRTKYAATQTWDAAFRSLYTGKIPSYLNEITPPLIFATVMSSVAQTVNSIYGSWPIVSFQGFPPGSEGIAKKNELLINLQLRECDSFNKAVVFFMKANIDGTAVGDIGWNHIQHLRQYRTYVPGTREMIEVRDMVTSFDGPDWQQIALGDFRPEPGKRRPREWSWYIKQYTVDFDDLLEMQGGDREQGPFDPQALQALAESGPPATMGTLDEMMTASRLNSFQDWLGAQSRPSFSKPVRIREMRGLVPIEFAPDGVRQRVVLIANERVVLRNDPDKLLLSKPRVFAYSPTPDPDHFVGFGKAQIGEQLQAMAGRLMSSKLDAFDLFLKPMFIVAEGATRSQNMIVKPGRMFPVNTKNRPIGEVIQALPVNLQPLAMAYQEFGFLDGMIQKGTGISESAIMGVNTGGGDMTARQFLGQQDAAMTRLNLENMLASSDTVEVQAEVFRDLNKTCLPLPKQFAMIGTRAVINPLTGMELPPEQGMISDPGELNHDFSAKAFGPSFMLTKSAGQAQAMQLAQMMSTNPVWVQSVNWIAFGRKLFSLFDWNADEMMVQNPMVQQMATMMGASPEQAVQAPNGPLFGGAGGQQMAPVQQGGDVQNNPLPPGA